MPPVTLSAAPSLSPAELTAILAVCRIVKFELDRGASGEIALAAAAGRLPDAYRTFQDTVLRQGLSRLTVKELVNLLFSRYGERAA